jgi:hypothetical protein
MEELRTTGRMENLDKEYFRKDGSRVSVQMGSVTMDDPATEGMAVMVDVTPIQEAQRALREADRRKDEFLAMLTSCASAGADHGARSAGSKDT